jgi:hypothetical protein
VNDGEIKYLTQKEWAMLEYYIRTFLELGAKNSNSITAFSTLAIALFTAVTFLLTLAIFISSKRHEKEVKNLISELKIAMIMNVGSGVDAEGAKKIYEDYHKKFKDHESG